jgi:hypothetical protein
MTIEEQAQGVELAQHIAAALKDHPHAEVRVNPVIDAAIPPHIASNLLEFLRRVQSTGMEAVAWVEAYQYIQQYAPQQPKTGEPFGGLPPK